MALVLRSPTSPSPEPFSWNVPSPPAPLTDGVGLPEAPTTWLSSKDMKMYGSDPMKNDGGVFKCKDCKKPILRSAVGEHVENCTKIRKQGNKTLETDATKSSKKRKAEDELDDPSASKKKKATPKVTKGRLKGPVDLEKQCGVINDKGLPCSRSLTCKSHSMGAKRAVTGRSRGYDELLLEWNRAHNPNFVEPVKRETKAEKKEKKDREKAEKKRLAAEAAAAAGESTTAAPGAAKKSEGGPAKSKKKKTATAANAGAGPAAAAQAAHKDSDDEDLAGIDSDEEMESLIRAVHAGTSRGLVGQPLALPNDVSPWFVVRRERLRNCHQHISQALNFSNLGGLGQSRPGLLASTTRLA